MKKLIVLVLLLAGCGVAGDRGYDWVNSQVYSPMSSRSQLVSFHIDPGESSDQIGQDLYNHGLIHSSEVFLVWVKYRDTNARLEAGDFVLNKNMNMIQIIQALGKAQPKQVVLSLPEGYTLQQMAQAAEKSGLGTAADYQTAAQASSWQYDFLANRPASAPKSLEGFLFPDTYQLDKTATARDLVKRQLDRFGQQFTPALRAQAGQPAASRPAESVFSIVTLASIVEREVSRDPDRAIICGIFYNRLAKGMPLQTDVTVLYGLNKLQGPLTEPDKQKDTPYNTYLHPGLPPGPVSNSGMASINACLAPQKTDYYYFFSDAHGITRYAKTYAEHQQQQQQYGVAPE